MFVDVVGRISGSNVHISASCWSSGAGRLRKLRRQQNVPVGVHVSSFCLSSNYSTWLITLRDVSCQARINNVGGQHRWLFAFLAACYEL